MLKIGVLGAGNLGKIHLEQIKQIPDYTLVGFYDSNAGLAKAVSEKYGIMAYSAMEELIKDVDVVDVVVPTVHHFECVEAAIKQSKHVFIEKPLAASVVEAKKLVSLAHEANVKTQVGHAERFNPAFLAIKDKCEHPMFIEAHRLSRFNAKDIDASVVLDLMLHDIDIVLSLVKSDVKRISASGVAIVSDTPDIASARIDFDNGCVANLTASRMSLSDMRKIRIFQKDAYITIDMLEQKAAVVGIREVNEINKNGFMQVIDPGNGKKAKGIIIEQPVIANNNAIREELATFAKSIMNNQPARVTIEDGAKALEIAHKVIEKIEFLQTT